MTQKNWQAATGKGEKKSIGELIEAAGLNKYMDHTEDGEIDKKSQRNLMLVASASTLVDLCGRTSLLDGPDEMNTRYYPYLLLVDAIGTLLLACPTVSDDLFAIYEDGKRKTVTTEEAQSLMNQDIKTFEEIALQYVSSLGEGKGKGGKAVLMA